MLVIALRVAVLAVIVLPETGLVTVTVGGVLFCLLLLLLLLPFFWLPCPPPEQSLWLSAHLWFCPEILQPYWQGTLFPSTQLPLPPLLPDVPPELLLSVSQT
jgi:hypothetical protein